MPDGPAPAQQFLRGPLKYDVDSPSPQLEGGRLFSVYVRVTNPYESPVSLLSVSVSLPAEFRDEANINTGFWRTAKAQFRQEITNRIVLADNVLPSTNESAQEASEILLQHGNSSLKQFKFRTWKVTLFTPATYVMEFQVQYKIDNVLNQDTIRKEFNIRATLGAVLRGALWGAVVGTFLHKLYDWKNYGVNSKNFHHFPLGFILDLLASLLLSGVLVIAFARKKDAQPFISIEDFYGGFFVGFSAGYIGKALLEKVLPH
jgi:hypothetical protein